jgi:hypothetical protein
MKKPSRNGMDNLIGRIVRYKDIANRHQLSEPMWVLAWYIDNCVKLILVDKNNDTYEKDLSACIFESLLLPKKPDDNTVHHAGLNSLIGKRVSHPSPSGPTVESTVFDWSSHPDIGPSLILYNEHGFLKYPVSVCDCKIVDE